MLEGDPDVVEVHTCAGAAEALRALEAGGFDLLFVDVQMPDMSGFELIEAHGQERVPVTVFLTAYDQYAIHAFETGAVDYLLKPFSDERFARAMARAKSTVESRRLLAAADPPPAGLQGPPLLRLIVRSGSNMLFIPVSQIDWIEAADYYVTIHVGGKQHLSRISLAALERGLAPDAFLRIHRRTIVRISQLRSLQIADGAWEVELLDGTRLPVSRRLRHHVRDRLRDLTVES